MTVQKLIRRTLAVASLLSMGAFAAPALAQSQICGVTGASTTATEVIYDPFAPNGSGLGTTRVSMTMTRTNVPGFDRTDTVDFYLKAQNAQANGTSIVPRTVTGLANWTGADLEIFYPFASAGPNLTQPNGPGNGYLHIDFTGNNQGSDTVVINFDVTLPANLNVAATPSLSFDIIYRCTAKKSVGSGVSPNAMVFPIRVLSGLQASFVGSALDFGEVGDKTTDAVLTAPATYTTPASNYIRVQSSGPYSVALSSPNSYRLTFPGGSPTVPAQRLAYQVRFLGQTMTTTSPTFNTVTCLRAGVPLATANVLPIRATLLEGGLGPAAGGAPKQVSPNYAETLVVTVTPLVSLPAPANQQNCPTLPTS